MGDTVWRIADRDGWTFRLLVADTGLSDLTDVEVRSPDQRRWVGTVGTLEAIDQIMTRYRRTGECLAGTYFWSSGLLILRDAEEEAAFDALEDLVRSGEHEACFEEVESDD